jgi:CDP-diglyceride synthetase
VIANRPAGEITLNEKRRVLLCLLSTLIACGGMVLSGLWEPAEKLLHRWANGVLICFLLIFLASMIVTLRVKLSRPIWVVPICAALGYPAASLAYIIYFSTFEPQRIVNSFGQGEPMTAIFMLLLVMPTGSFAWLFGAIAGLAFFLLSRLLEKSAPSGT